MSKEYGLIIPKSKKVANKPDVIKRPSVFNDDSDSSDESAKPTGFGRGLKRQDRTLQKKAVEEDPTVYQYDEIFDEMTEKKTESKLARKDLDRKPKYISKLLVAADRRKRENERRIERQVQKERETEGDQFKDKETFVTTAYKKKLEEMRELEEQERREEYLESIGDVTKQGNLDGFYRHLYDQKVNKCEIKKEATEGNAENETNADSDKDSSEATTATIKDEKSLGEADNREKKKPQKRKYRTRDDSSSSENDEPAKEMAHLNSNLDADSDFSIDSESEHDEPKSKDVVETKKSIETAPIAAETAQADVEEKALKEVTEVKEKKPKIDIWKKRTVGVVFDEALQRYFERKALRESG